MDWDENDYAVVDETGSAGFTRIYMERAGSLQPMPVPPRNSGMADTLDEAKAALVKRYEEVKNGGSEGPQRRRVPGYEVGYHASLPSNAALSRGLRLWAALRPIFKSPCGLARHAGR